jgi:hypothetical protein
MEEIENSPMRYGKFIVKMQRKKIPPAEQEVSKIFIV